jgi:hypothetical protein
MDIVLSGELAIADTNPVEGSGRDGNFPAALHHIIGAPV